MGGECVARGRVCVYGGVCGGLDGAEQVSQGEVSVCDESFDLMELCQVRCVQRFVAEHAVDGEQLAWGEHGLLRHGVQHAAGHGGGVRAQDVLLRLLHLPLVPVPDAPLTSHLMHRLHPVHIPRRHLPTPLRPSQEERVVAVPRRMLLRLEQRVEVPERRLYVVVGGHLLEAHLQQDGAELVAHLHERVESAGGGGDTARLEVVLLQRGGGPGGGAQHVQRQVGQLRLALRGEGGALGDGEGLDSAEEIEGERGGEKGWGEGGEKGRKGVVRGWGGEVEGMGGGGTCW